MPRAYSRTQIALHWAIFLLIVLQFLGHEWIAEAWEKIEHGEDFAFSPLIAGHVFGGLLVLTLVVWRIVLRLTRGAPPLPAEEPAPLRSPPEDSSEAAPRSRALRRASASASES